MKIFDVLNNKVNNKGVSLVEMIVVIAIMSVMIGAASIGIGMISTKPATQCASNMEICLNRCRTQTMGKNNGFIAFFSDGDGIYMVQKLSYTNINVDDSSDCAAGDYVKRKIGKKGVNVTCGGVNLSSNPNTPVYYCFERSAGSFEGCKDSSFSDLGDGTIVVNKGSKTYTITIQKLTGKVIVTKS